MSNTLQGQAQGAASPARVLPASCQERLGTLQWPRPPSRVREPCRPHWVCVWCRVRNSDLGGGGYEASKPGPFPCPTFPSFSRTPHPSLEGPVEVRALPWGVRGLKKRGRKSRGVHCRWGTVGQVHCLLWGWRCRTGSNSGLAVQKHLLRWWGAGGPTWACPSRWLPAQSPGPRPL